MADELTRIRVPRQLHERMAKEAAKRQVGAILLYEMAIKDYLKNLQPVRTAVRIDAGQKTVKSGNVTTKYS